MFSNCLCFVLLLFLHGGMLKIPKDEADTNDFREKSRDKTYRDDNFWKYDLKLETKISLDFQNLFEDLKRMRSVIPVENDIHFPYEEIFFFTKKTADQGKPSADKINVETIMNQLFHNINEQTTVPDNTTYTEVYEKAATLLNSFYSDKKEAYSLLLNASRMGSKEAKAEVAWGLAYGTYLEQNVSMAKELFEQLSEEGEPEGHSGMGFLRATGLAVGSSQARALVHYTVGALGGSLPARMALGFRYLLGVSVPANCEKALDFYRLVAGHVAAEVEANGGAVFHRVRLLDEADDPDYRTGLIDKDVLDYYLMLANNGDAGAQIGLGHMYYRGARGLPKDYGRALLHFKQAAATGNPVALAYVGKIYLEGDSEVKVDLLNAYLSFRKSADQGNAIGQYGLGMMYLNGKFVEKNTQRGLLYLTQSADQGWVESLLVLGSMCLEGKEMKRDYRLARKYFFMASQLGHVLGYYNLGQMHASGIGTMRSCTTAVELFKNVAERGKWSARFMEAYNHYKKRRFNESFVIYAHLAEMGYEVAQNNAAYLLDKGLFSFGGESEKDKYSRAMILWGHSALQGNPSALLKLGDYHFYGVGGLREDHEAAAGYYRTASERHRHPQALFNLGYMHEHGLGLERDEHLAKRCYDLAAEASPDARLPVLLALARMRLVGSVAGLAGVDWLRMLELRAADDLLGGYWDLYLSACLILCAAYILHWRLNRRDLFRDMFNYL